MFATDKSAKFTSQVVIASVVMLEQAELTAVVGVAAPI
jgi:hypothetical protein